MSSLSKATDVVSFEDFLMEQGLITPKFLQIAQREAKKTKTSLDKSLAELGFMEERKISHLLSQFWNLPFIDLETAQTLEATLKNLDKNLLTGLPDAVLPFNQEKKKIHIALGLPTTSCIHKIQTLFAGWECIFYVASSSQIKKLQATYLPCKASLDHLFTQLNNLALIPSPLSAEIIPSILDKCLEDALLERASDIHLEPDHKVVRLRLRIDGHLSTHHVFHKDFWDSLCVHLKVCAHMNIAENRLPQNGRFSRFIHGREMDFRVSTHPTKQGESIVIRVLDRASALVPLEELGFPPKIFQQILKAVHTKEGLFILCGPTGSGKTTTLYALLNTLKNEARNIMTLEQPIEYDLSFVRQTEVQEHSTFTFAQGIRSILRQDPDIILIGEIRDADTAQMALRAAMTGHQVYSTLHAPNALGVLQRLKDLGISSTTLASNLRGLLSQRLIRKLCPHCRSKGPVPPIDKEKLPNSLDFIHQASGCPSCRHTGYKGRFPLVEFILCSPHFNHLVLQNASLKELEDEARQEGYISIEDQALQAINEGLTSPQEIFAVMPELDLKNHACL